MKINYLFFASFFLLSCNNDEEVLLNKGVVNYSIDGKSGSFTRLNSRASTLFTFGNDTTELITFLVSVPDKLPVTYDSKTEELIVVGYINEKEGIRNEYTNTTILGEELKSSFKITINKYSDKKTSGEFEFTVYNKNDNSDSKNIKGNFVDVPDL